MRRTLSIVFFVGVIAWGVFMFVRRNQPKAPEASEPVTKVEEATPPATSPPPRLALPTVRLDAGVDLRAVVLSDEQLLQAIRENVRSHPERAESLAREDRQRFPDSANADERDALLVDALINQQHIGAARSETYYYNDHHPSGRFAEHLFVMTGVHPTPTGPGPR
jgi:type IV secretory pathway VirB10-like protein